MTVDVKRCACGCGTEIPFLTRRGRPQRFAWGHNGTIDPLDLVRHKDCGYRTPCWVWQGGKTSDGRYGRHKYKGRIRPAHHIFLLQSGVEIPEGYEPDHLCCVTLCVNPAHLEVVARVENVRRSASTKLTQSDVDEIRRVRDLALAWTPYTAKGRPRRRVSNGLTIRKELAAQYGVTPDQIKHIWAGRSWAN